MAPDSEDNAIISRKLGKVFAELVSGVTLILNFHIENLGL
jgi:hypothetical protein